MVRGLMPEPTPVRLADVEAAVGALRAKPEDKRRVLAALAYDVLSRQAEGRTVYAGQKLVQSRAEEHGVDADAASTRAGNLLSILERGAETPLERALVAAFAVAGFGDAAGGDSAGRQASERLFRFVRHADWLEVCTDFRVYPFVDELLDAALAGHVWRELAQAVADEATGRDGELPRVRARNAARLSALASSRTDAARGALRSVVSSSALDEVTRHVASTLAGDGAASAVPASLLIEGELGRARRGGAVETLRWVSGWAILAWLLRGLAFLLGVRRRAEVRLGRAGLEVRSRTTLLGRVIREQEETWRLEALETASRQVRYPSLHLLVGVLCGSLGLLSGGLFLFDGARSGELVLLGVGAALIVGGAGLDLVLDVLVPGARGKASVELHARAQRPLRLTRVSLADADSFLRALRKDPA
jgi:hypothetical protein